VGKNKGKDNDWYEESEDEDDNPDASNPGDDGRDP
jgi:hypothetical protein